MIEIFVFFTIILTIALIMENIDINKVSNLTDCKYTTTYCTDYASINNIKYVTKEPINEKETIDLLLSKIEDDSNRMDQLVYWRISLIVSIVVCIFYLFFNKLGNTNIPLNSYLFLLISCWFLNYWMRNHLDFHYHDHMHIRIKDSIEQVRKKINKYNI